MRSRARLRARLIVQVQNALRSQSKSRLVGANCPGIIFPHARIKLGIQPLVVHQPGYVGLASRSGTISYELASLTTGLGAGQSVVFGLGGDPFPGTRTWEALQYMLDDPKTRIIALVGEIGGQSKLVHMTKMLPNDQWKRKRLSSTKSMSVSSDRVKPPNPWSDSSPDRRRYKA